MLCSILFLAIALAWRPSSALALTNTCGAYIDPTGSFACNGNPNKTQALEIIDVVSSMASVATGDNPMSLKEFEALPLLTDTYLKNTPRNLQFSSSCFFKSPSAPLDCAEGEEANCLKTSTVEALNNTTWGDIALMKCSQYYVRRDTPMVPGPAPAGDVVVVVIDKAQNLTFTSPQVYILTDEWGNQYIMHASSAATTEGVAAAAAAAVFPPGWTLAHVELSAPFTIFPKMSENGSALYTVVRDSQDNSYHQFSCLPGPQPTDAFAACPAATKSTAVAPTPAPSPLGEPPQSSYTTARGLSVILLQTTIAFLV